MVVCRTPALASRRGSAAACPKVVTWGISRHERVRFSLMARRRGDKGDLATSRPAAPAACTSSAVTRSPGPVPRTAARSTPRSLASLRTAGRAWTDPEPTTSRAGSSSVPMIGALSDPRAAGRRRPDVSHTSPSVPTTASSVPTSIVASCGPPWWRTNPANGEGMSTTALSVSISTRGSSRSTHSPTSTYQDKMTASASPSPMSGR